MKSAPTQRQIDEAELRLVASRIRTRGAVAQLSTTAQALRTEARAKISQASKFALAAAAGILIGKFLLRRIWRRPVTPKGVATGGLVAALLGRFGWRVLTGSGWRFLAGTALRLWSRQRPRRQSVFNLSAVRKIPSSVVHTVH